MKKCLVFNEDGMQVMCGRRTTDNCYDIVPNLNLSCRSARVDLMELWHQRLGHANHKQLSKITKLDVVVGLPKFGKFQKTICGPCQMGKQTRSLHPKVNQMMTKRPLELLHVYLMGLTCTESLGGKRYILVMVDDFSRFTWVELLREKLEVAKRIKKPCIRLQVEKNSSIARLRSDQGKEFEKSKLENFVRNMESSKSSLLPRLLNKMGLLNIKIEPFKRWLG